MYVLTLYRRLDYCMGDLMVPAHLLLYFHIFRAWCLLA
jgi:hypothetical protein